ncbi:MULTISPECIES: ABC transporter substrate-binding protein [unclassified Pseudoclavibacter]|uniref:ABC transporter substrate-binding protein n=1 Tax=unclassified Pseudoclavibacter TaxID=2615177 RepID=UPI001BA7A3C8|nr:ABC transporter substrate-binding protein [Pseudoclavibacter sp. Marseille-Q4354]MBS3179864.1 carbohydrate ABC transporter substrate-binding protein [Pseudoclavibacter sp. Marseille-Q4354]
MKHSTRLVSLIAASAVGATALAGCASGGSDSENVTLNVVWWGNESRADMYEQAIDLFETQNPGITVNGNFADFSSYWNARSTETAARSLPDVMQFDQANLVQFGQNGQLLDLSPYLGNQVNTGEMDDVVIDAATVNGTQVGVPVGTSTLGLFVDPSLVEQAGVAPLDPDYTWEDLNTWVSDVTASGITTPDGNAVYGGFDHGITMWFFIQWLLQEGVEPFTETGEFGFTKDDVTEFMSSTSALRDAGAFVPPARITQLAPADGFAAGEAASSLTWDSYFARYTDIEDLQTLPVPTGSNGEKDIFYTVLHMAGAANTEHPEETAKLLDFFASDPEVANIFGTSRGIPTNPAQLDALEVEDGSLEAQSIAYRESLEGYETVNTPQLPPYFATLESAWVSLNSDLTYGTITVEQFADQWFAEAQQAAL